MMRKELHTDRYTARIIPALLLVGISIMLTALLLEKELPLYFYYLDFFSWLLPHFIFTLLSFTIQRYYHTPLVFNGPNLTNSLLFAGLALWTYFGISQLYVAPDSHPFSQSVLAYWFRGSASTLYFLLTTALFWIEQEQMRSARLSQYNVEKERSAMQIQLNSLQQQFKPHFLFNSLNSINALTLTNPEEARRMVHLLSEFMRAAVREDQGKLIPFTQECAHLKLYSEIEKVRFGDRLQVVFTSSEEADACTLPALILQPLIENAVKYGLYGHIDKVQIRIQGSKVDGRLRVEISNPYDPTLSGQSGGTGFGLRSIEKKMFILYQQANLLQIEKDDAIFNVILSIPQA
jgi:LytS/YehU family sensor histidine kinase